MPAYEVNGKKLSHFRRAHNMSQADLALTAGVSERTVRNAEAGRRIRGDFIEYMAIALKVQIADLLVDPSVLKLLTKWRQNVHFILDNMTTYMQSQDAAHLKTFVGSGVELISRSHFQASFDGEYSKLSGASRFFDKALAWVGAWQEWGSIFDRHYGDGNVVVLEGRNVFRGNEHGEDMYTWWQHTYLLDELRVVRYAQISSPITILDAPVAQESPRSSDQVMSNMGANVNIVVRVHERERKNDGNGMMRE